MSESMIGRVFSNRYQITERIGVGGMAEVYRAQDNVLGRIVAVKIMLPQYAADPSFTQRFKQEAASAANLQSPYIVNIYDWGHDGDTYYIVMEYVRGSDLKTAINERGAINQRKVAEIGLQVCQALSVAHKLDIIHRDIKPQNIMVQPDGNAKVMDFGIARAKNSTKTQTSSVLGTAHYISPEQAQGKELTPASDIYSLGVVMYEATCGRLPFDAPDAVSVALKQVNELPPAPSEINPAIDPSLEAIILKAMEKNPEDRFATANDMRLALSDFLAGRPVNLNGASSNKTSVMGGRSSVATAVIAGTAGAALGGAASAYGDETAMMPPVSGRTTTTTVRSSTGSGSGSSSSSGMSSGKKAAIGIGVAVVAILAIVGIALAVSGGLSSLFGSGVTVPNVRNETIEDATQILEDSGLVVSDIVQIADDDIEEGLVVRTDPSAGERVEEGSEIILYVSSGTDTTEVPNVVGKTAEEAEELIESAGLTAVQDDSEYSSTVAAGQIISQSPDAGEEVATGTEVHYVVSLGEETASVPDVRNYSQSQAISTLQSAGFSVVVNSEYSDSVSEGYVISQSPSSGSTVAAGSTITLVVSAGPEPEQTATVPNVVGSSESSAISRITSAGFAYNVEYVYSDSVAQGYVISQSPSGNSTATVGATITIVVSDGPEYSEESSDSSSE